MKTHDVLGFAALSFWYVASFGLGWAALNSQTFTTTLFAMTAATFTFGLVALIFAVSLKVRENRGV